MTSHPTLFFDGVCNLCNGAVQWLLLHDRKGLLRFASLQSDLGRRLMEEEGLDPDRLDSLILYHEGKILKKSEAVLRLAKLLGWPYRLGVLFRGLPLFLRDGIYDWVARNRYRWFGKNEACMLPRPEWRARFLA